MSSDSRSDINIRSRYLYRVPLSDSETSSNWRSRDSDSESSSISSSSLLAIKSISELPSSFYIDRELAEAHIFRNYRSKYWKSNYKNRNRRKFSTSSTYEPMYQNYPIGVSKYNGNSSIVDDNINCDENDCVSSDGVSSDGVSIDGVNNLMKSKPSEREEEKILMHSKKSNNLSSQSNISCNQPTYSGTCTKSSSQSNPPENAQSDISGKSQSNISVPQEFNVKQSTNSESSLRTVPNKDLSVVDKSSTRNKKYTFIKSLSQSSTQSITSRKKNKCRHSYGIILRNPKTLKYLVIHRKYSIGCEELVRSKWCKNDLQLIISLCNDMTNYERKNITNSDCFKRMWSDLLLSLDEEVKGDYMSSNYLSSEKKFRELCNGYWYDLSTGRALDLSVSNLGASQDLIDQLGASQDPIDHLGASQDPIDHDLVGRSIIAPNQDKNIGWGIKINANKGVKNIISNEIKDVKSNIINNTKNDDNNSDSSTNSGELTAASEESSELTAASEEIDQLSSLLPQQSVSKSSQQSVSKSNPNMFKNNFKSPNTHMPNTRNPTPDNLKIIFVSWDRICNFCSSSSHSSILSSFASFINSLDAIRVDTLDTIRDNTLDALRAGLPIDKFRIGSVLDQRLDMALESIDDDIDEDRKNISDQDIKNDNDRDVNDKDVNKDVNDRDVNDKDSEIDDNQVNNEEDSVNDNENNIKLDNEEDIKTSKIKSLKPILKSTTSKLINKSASKSKPVIILKKRIKKTSPEKSLKIVETNNNIKDKQVKSLLTRSTSGQVTKSKNNESKTSESKTIKTSTVPRKEKPALEFPKGRRDKSIRESGIACAIREFEEETNINKKLYTIKEICPLREKTIGLNGYRYNYIYFLADLNDDQDVTPFLNPKNTHQISEISEIKWATYDEIQTLIRPCDKSRKYIFEKAHKIFEILYKK